MKVVIKSTIKWYPLMERLGQSLAIEKNLKVILESN